MTADNWITLFEITVTLGSVLFGIIKYFQEQKTAKTNRELQDKNEELNKAYTKLNATHDKLSEAYQKLQVAEENIYVDNCKRLAEIVGNLAENIGDACKTIDTLCAMKNGNCVYITTKVHSANEYSWDLIRYCVRINDDHKKKFNHPAIPNLQEQLEKRACIKAKRSNQ